jgi:hypothetical protein
MPETSLTLIVASLLLAVALVAWLVARAVIRRVGALREQLQTVDARLVRETSVLATRMGAQRADLAGISTASERVLWSVARYDERLEGTRAGLAMRRDELDRARARLVAARGTILRAQRTALMLMKLIELRRAILG